LAEEIEAVQVCAEQAEVNGPDFRVAGSFATTVSTVRDLTSGAAPGRWPQLSAEMPAVICYLDGPVPEAPPGVEPFDRAVIAVAGGHAELIIAGYRDEIEIQAP
jgi:hypothetical protein